MIKQPDDGQRIICKWCGKQIQYAQKIKVISGPLMFMGRSLFTFDALMESMQICHLDCDDSLVAEFSGLLRDIGQDSPKNKIKQFLIDNSDLGLEELLSIWLTK